MFSEFIFSLAAALWISIAWLPLGNGIPLFDQSSSTGIVIITTAAIGFRRAMAFSERSNTSEHLSWPTLWKSIAAGFAASFIANQCILAAASTLYLASLVPVTISLAQYASYWLWYGLVWIPISAAPEMFLFCLVFDLPLIAIGVTVYGFLRDRGLPA